MNSSTDLKCRRIKHLINLYNDRVYSVLENVLVREVDKQENKVKAEINKVIEGKKFALRQPPSEVDWKKIYYINIYEESTKATK